MTFRSIYRPCHLRLLTTVLDEHCASRGIMSKDGRERVAVKLIELFATADMAADALRRALQGVTIASGAPVA